MYSIDCLSSSFRLCDAFRTASYNRKFYKDHPEYFDPDGILLFCGGQGTGKTLSAVNYIQRLVNKYPTVKIVSNTYLNLDNYDNDSIIPFESISAVSTLDNGYNGIILFLDEIQTVFSSLESLKINPSVIATISQQRKRRLHVVGTTQLFRRLAKPWREQCNGVIDCKAYGPLQCNFVVNLGTICEDQSGNLTGYQYSNRFFFFRSPKMFERYDTFQKIFKSDNKEDFKR